MKRTITLTLVAALAAALFLSSCSSSSSNPSPSSNASPSSNTPSEPVDVVVWNTFSEHQLDAFQAIVDAKVSTSKDVAYGAIAADLYGRRGKAPNVHICRKLNARALKACVFHHIC